MLSGRPDGGRGWKDSTILRACVLNVAILGIFGDGGEGHVREETHPKNPYLTDISKGYPLILQWTADAKKG